MSDLEVQGLSKARLALREIVRDSKEQRASIDEKMAKITRGVDGRNLQKMDDSNHTPENDPPNLESAPTPEKNESEGGANLEDPPKKRVLVPVGEVIFKTWEQIERREDLLHKNLKMKKAGRPKKIKEEKMDRVSVFFSPEEKRVIDLHSPKDKLGRPRRSGYVRSRLDKLARLEVAQNKQIALIKKLLKEVDRSLHAYADQAKDSAELFTGHNKESVHYKEMQNRMKEVRTVQSLVMLDEVTLKEQLI
jgi:hypothetical protein